MKALLLAALLFSPIALANGEGGGNSSGSSHGKGSGLSFGGHSTPSSPNNGGGIPQVCKHRATNAKNVSSCF